MSKRIAMVFLKGTDKAWAIQDCDTLEHALELAEIVLYDKGELNLGIPVLGQLEARWGHLMDLPGNTDVVAATRKYGPESAPDEPAWIGSGCRYAWKDGWAAGYTYHREHGDN